MENINALWEGFPKLIGGGLSFVAGAPNFAAWFAVGLFSFAVGMVIYLGLETRKAKQTLRQFNHFLAGVKNQQDFVSQFNTLYDKTKGTPYETLWREYDETLVKPDGNDVAIIRLSQRPQVYFMSVIQKTLPAGKTILVPQLLIGVGLLFTFIGLAGALAEASGTMSGGVEEMKGAVEGILAAASVKFLCSIGGLSGALLINACSAYYRRTLQRELGQFCDYLEKFTIYCSPQKIGTDQLQEMREQTTQLKNFNTDLAIKIGDQIQSKLTSSLEETLVPHIESIAKNLEAFSSSGKDVIQDAFNSSGTGDVLVKLTETLTKLNNQMGTVGTSFGDQMQDVLSELKETLTTLTQTLEDRLVGAGASYEKSVATGNETLEQGLAKIAKHVTSMQDSVGGATQSGLQQTQKMHEVGEQFTKIIAHVEKTLERIVNTASPISETATQIGQASERMSALAPAIENGQQHMEKLSNNLMEGVRELQNAWENYDQRFEQADQTLATTIGLLIKGAEQYQQAMRTGFDEFDVGIAKISNTLKSATEDVSESFETLSDALADKKIS